MRQGYAAARSYLPKLNAAWWSTLSVLRQQSPPDAIVNTWWDYGYWTKYVAERRVNNDGGSLRTHIPYWTARALAAPTERESAGLLRMLDCGSDATPEAEGNEGAYGKLLSYGVDGLKAEAIILRTGADGSPAGAGIPGRAKAERIGASRYSALDALRPSGFIPASDQRDGAAGRVVVPCELGFSQSLRC